MSADVHFSSDSARRRAEAVIRKERWAIGNRRRTVGAVAQDVGRIGSQELSPGLFDKRSSPDDLLSPGLIGLAISGGGIRSATFALGLLQALAKADVLKYFDYLSTVSGGGFIGGAITWLLRGSGGDPVHGLGPQQFPFGTAEARDRQDTRHWRGILRYLREHGNYLVPGGGITLLSGIAVVLRGILLNLIVWLPILTGLFIVVLWLASTFNRLAAAAFGLFILLCVVYSLGTGISRKRAPDWLNRYSLRRWFETWIKWLPPLAAGFVAIGTLPLVVTTLEDMSAGGGILSFALGTAGAIKKSFNGKDSKIGIVAPLSAALLLYGFALLAAWLAFKVSGPHLLVRELYFYALLISIGTGIWVNINYISLHRFYRDRLMEVFMPDRDNIEQQKTGPAPGADTGRLSRMWNDGREPIGHHGGSPYHIVNTNLVLADSKDRKYQSRGGDNFILTPFFCGSDATGYVGTRGFQDDGMTLSTAVAISGAAVNPHADVGGSTLLRNRLISWLMALLNVRLGYWVQNPSWLLDGRAGRYRRQPNHLTSLRYEILPAGLEENRKWLQLSDGGHFENLGLYELIRRRARLIIVSDAGADPDYCFGDLRNAILRAGQDFRAKITFGRVFWARNDEPDGEAHNHEDNRELLSRLIPSETFPAGFPRDTALAERGHIIGVIDYGIGDDGRPERGILILVKSTLVEGLSLETRGYKGENPSFPHQTTADQFFDERQFEAYRELGFRIGNMMVEHTRLKSLIATVRG